MGNGFPSARRALTWLALAVFICTCNSADVASPVRRLPQSATDVTPPTVAITSPTAGTVVSGVFTITADATDEGEVAGVQFQIDGNLAGSELTTPPYSLDVDSHTLTNGQHALTAVARDTAGNPATSEAVSIEVNNPPPQNVVVIMTDDQRADLMQYMALTSSLLNAETVRFSRGFATTSLCCPSRSSFLTGLYAHNTGVQSNALPTGGAAKFNPSSTLATWLHDAGYRTGLIGKYLNEYWRIRPAVPPGWDNWQVFYNEDPNYFNYDLLENGKVVHYGTAASAYSTDVLAQKATEFIWATPPQQPFLLVFTPYAPHLPYTPSPTDVGTSAGLPNWRPPSYNEADVSDKPAWIRSLPRLTTSKMAASDVIHRKQVESLQSVDRAVASIITALQLSGRWGSTMVVFFSDNG